ncbi:gonadotropin-releasing hormone receptor-like [Thrips palmi]|uniref:Gonadotropin-releasing hormone receptor-like n=1 Tax=Thrips palmi TaxID=161013 RepID=A0A6P8ZKK5_THRPL|nr:gonadotropin-releasing hormone receptor-like [Thrips palmi]
MYFRNHLVVQLLMFSVKEGPFYEPYYQCVTYDVSTESERLYNIINFITMFVIPLLGLVASYLSIYCTLSRGQREIRSVDKMTIATYDQNRQRSMKRAMKKSRWIAVVIVCAYLVSWLPYYITMLVYFLSPDQEQWYDSKWMDWIFFFGMGNSVVNPAIYGMFQLWKPKRRRQWSCFRHRDGSTQVSQFVTQDSFRRHGTAAFIATTASLTTPRVCGDVVLEVPVVVRTAGKAGPFGWRAKFLRKYRALRAHSQAHI